MYRLRLKREVCFMLGAVVMCLVTLLMNHAIDNYNEFLQKCDERNGYTCNIYGK